MIIINSYIINIINGNNNRYIYILIIIIFIYSRGIIGRYKYNNIIIINWRDLIPLTFSFLILYKLF